MGDAETVSMGSAQQVSFVPRPACQTPSAAASASRTARSVSQGSAAGPVALSAKTMEPVTRPLRALAACLEPAAHRNRAVGRAPWTKTALRAAWQSQSTAGHA